MPVATSLLRDVFGSTTMALIVIGLWSGVDTGIGATNGNVVPVGGFVGSVPSLVNKMVAPGVVAESFTCCTTANRPGGGSNVGSSGPPVGSWNEHPANRSSATRANSRIGVGNTRGSTIALDSFRRYSPYPSED